MLLCWVLYTVSRVLLCWALYTVRLFQYHYTIVAWLESLFTTWRKRQMLPERSFLTTLNVGLCPDVSQTCILVGLHNRPIVFCEVQFLSSWKIFRRNIVRVLNKFVMGQTEIFRDLSLFTRRSCPSVCPHVSVRRPLIQTDRSNWNLILWAFMSVCREIPNLAKIGHKSRALHRLIVAGEIKSP